jgi:hypothetical protein
MAAPEAKRRFIVVFFSLLMAIPFARRRSLRRIFGFRHEYHWFAVIRALK